MHTTKGNMLPNVYEMDDFRDCVKNQNNFCKVKAVLSPTNSGNSLWKIIQERNSSTSFDRSRIYRMMCIPKENSANTELMEKYCYGSLKEKFENQSLVPSITNIRCMDKDSIKGYPSSSYYFEMSLLISFLYIAWIIFATIYDNKAKRGGPKFKPNEWISSFSLQKNWRTLTSSKQNGDSAKLRCIQSMRVLTTGVVVLIHAQLATVQLYHADIEYIETIFQNYFSYCIRVLLPFYVVQTFFVISSWLLTNQIYEIHNANGKFTLKDCLITLVNRAFRFWPTLIIMELSIAVLPREFFYTPQVFDLLDVSKNACAKYWTAPLLFYVNTVKCAADACNLGTWYIAADMQLYIATMVLCYIVLKYKLSMRKVLSSVLVFSVTLFAVIKFYHNDPIFISTSISDSMRVAFFYGERFYIPYTSAYSSWTTSLIGVAIGYFYYHTKNKEFNHGTIATVTWAVVFFGFPPLAVVSGDKLGGIGRFGSALVGSMLKPIYGLGFGVGLLGVVQGIGGPVKKLLEWRPLVILGNFTFSTYIWHFGLVFSRGVFTEGLFRTNVFEENIYQVEVLIASYVLGIAMCLIFEQPFLNLQKKILPQVKKRMEDKNCTNDVREKES